LSYLISSFYNAFILLFSLDAGVYEIVWTSLEVSVAATLFASAIGVPLGVFIALRRFRCKTLLLVILNTLMALPTVVVGLLFYALLSRRGPLGDLGLLYTPLGISLGLFVLAIPTVTNLTLAAIQGLDSRLILTCKLLGATPLQQTLKIVSEARFGVMASVVVSFGRVISEVGIAMMLGGNIRGFTRTMTTAIALETSKGEFELGLALGTILLAVAFAVNAALYMLQARRA
jgi:tungstate transport system permease protein